MPTKKKERLTAERLIAAAREIEQRPQGCFTTGELATALNADFYTVKAALELSGDRFEMLKAGRWRVRSEAEA